MSQRISTTGLIETVAELKCLNARAGHHFFARDSMRFFSSRIHPRIVAHRFFVTSERSGFDDPARCSTLRMIRDCGAVETVGEFLEFGSASAVFTALDEGRSPLHPAVYGRGALAPLGVSVRFDPYPSDVVDADGAPGSLVKLLGTISERDLNRRFLWRAYIGEMPIGSRTSKTDARAIAAEAARPCASAVAVRPGTEP